MQLKNTLFGSLALGSAALLLAPDHSEGFNLLGHSEFALCTRLRR